MRRTRTKLLPAAVLLRLRLRLPPPFLLLQPVGSNTDDADDVKVPLRSFLDQNFKLGLR